MADIAVVSGAGSGIGAATTRRLRERGISVVGVDLVEGSDAADLVWIQGDVADGETWCRAVDGAKKQFDGTPSILVLNAAYLAVGTVLELSDEQWQRLFSVNVFGAVRALRACLPGMIERKRGAVVTVGSVDATMAEQGLISYCASKGAILQLTRTIAVDHARDGVRANCVCPGVTDTPSFRRHLDTASDPEQFVKVREERNPLGRLIDPDEVAAMIVFLASDEASAITGATIAVDAGLSTSFDFRTGAEGA